MNNHITILITDPGIDDTIAILAAAGKEKDIAPIATYGNGPTQTTYANLTGLAKFITTHSPLPSQSSLPIYFGADRPLDFTTPFVGENVEFIHGKNLSEGLFQKEKAQSNPSSTLYEQIEKNKTPLDIISLGAVTEIAHILKRKNLIPLIKAITIMGGVLYNQGNVAPSVEANFSHDPKALQFILKQSELEKIPLTIVPLDLTEREELELTSKRLKNLTIGLGKKITKILNKFVGKNSTYSNFYKNKKGVYHYTNPLLEHRFKSCPIHDLTALLAHYHPELFRILKRPIIVSGVGEIMLPTAWMEKGVTCNIVLDIKNAVRYWEITKECLKQYS